MNRKLKLALAALLGFSAACSTVRNAPAKGEDNLSQEAVADSTQKFRQIIVMYGVRPPAGANTNFQQMKSQADSLTPVLELPKDDAPVLKPRVSPQSVVDPVVEKPAED